MQVLRKLNCAGILRCNPWGTSKINNNIKEAINNNIRGAINFNQNLKWFSKKAGDKKNNEEISAELAQVIGTINSGTNYDNKLFTEKVINEIITHDEHHWLLEHVPKNKIKALHIDMLYSRIFYDNDTNSHKLLYPNIIEMLIENCTDTLHNYLSKHSKLDKNHEQYFKLPQGMFEMIRKKGYQYVIAFLPESEWDIIDMKLEMLEKVGATYNKDEIRNNLKNNPNSPIIAKTLIMNGIRAKDLKGHVLWGNDFKHYFKHFGFKPIKVLYGHKRHGKMTYSEHKNFVDVNNFFPINKGAYGGMYFTIESEDAINIIIDAVYNDYSDLLLTPVTVCNDSMVYIAHWDGNYIKMKTNKFKLGHFRPMYDEYYRINVSYRE